MLINTHKAFILSWLWKTEIKKYDLTVSKSASFTVTTRSLVPEYLKLIISILFCHWVLRSSHQKYLGRLSLNILRSWFKIPSSGSRHWQHIPPSTYRHAEWRKAFVEERSSCVIWELLTRRQEGFLPIFPQTCLPLKPLHMKLPLKHFYGHEASSPLYSSKDKVSSQGWDQDFLQESLLTPPLLLLLGVVGTACWQAEMII